ncbi:hypothetical protein GF373_01345 [bacterium]|nr:hypothetical protein [bacterium]
MNLSEFIHNWWVWNQTILLQGLAMLFLFAALVRWIHRWPAKWRYGLMLLLLIKCAVPWPMAITLPPLPRVEIPSLSPKPAMEKPGMVSIPQINLNPLPKINTKPNVGVGNDKNIKSTQPSPSSSITNFISSRGLKTILFIFWLVGCIGLIAHAIASLLFLRSLQKQAETHPGLQKQINERGKAMGIASPPPVIITKAGHTPLVYGLIRPRILLSSDFTRLPAEKLHMLLVHELMHIKRMDHRITWLLSALQTAFWWNPIVHYFAKQTRMEMEHGCDEAVMQHYPNKTKEYGSLLLDIAETVAIHRHAAHGLAFSESKSTLQSRLRRIAMFHTTQHTTTKKVGIALILAAICLIPAWSLGTRTNQEDKKGEQVESTQTKATKTLNTIPKTETPFGGNLPAEKLSKTGNLERWAFHLPHIAQETSPKAKTKHKEYLHAVATILKQMLYGQMGEEKAKQEGRTIKTQPKNGIITIADTQQNIKRVADYLKSLTPKNNLIARQFRLLKPSQKTPQQREEFLHAVATILEQMLYGRIGKEIARKEGRLINTNPKEGTILIIDSQENLTRAENYLSSVYNIAEQNSSHKGIDLSKRIEGPLTVRNIDFAQVAGMVQAELGIDIVLGKGTNTQVTFHLTNPTLKQILDTVLPAHGMDYAISNSILYIDKPNQIKYWLTSQKQNQRKKVPPALLKHIDGPVSVTNMDLKPLLMLLQEKSGINMVLGEGIGKNIKVTFHLTHPTIKNILDAILPIYDLNYTTNKPHSSLLIDKTQKIKTHNAQRHSTHPKTTLPALNKPIDGPMTCTNMDLSQVLTFLQNESGVNMVLEEGNDKKVTFNLKSPTLKQVLDTILPPVGMDYYIRNNTIIIFDSGQPAILWKGEMKTNHPALNTPIHGTINFTNADLKAIVMMLQAGSGIRIVLEEGINTKATFNQENPTIKQVLDTILPPKGLDYLIMDNTVRIIQTKESSNPSNANNKIDSPTTDG